MDKKNVKISSDALKSRQSGAVLITTIVLMIIFTLLGVATMRANITDVAIQSSMKSRNNAFQCAEAALRDGEIWLSKLTEPAYQVSDSPAQDQNQVWQVNQLAIQNPESGLDVLWGDTGKTWAYSGTGLLTSDIAGLGCGSDPRYFIESLGALAPDSEGVDFATQSRGRSVMYRITAYSIGTDNNAAVVLQTTYLQPIN
ncbi:hypothetical protein MNBD_GAMMA11-1307 [hydrothermal vent metagenome]|uniref:Type IV fimbrial biogenesis protein PilX n=1 Tax=hydrothermal vent metagenome TaxID=652676 RepID=A0A3B0XS97_9ZZZZ